MDKIKLLLKIQSQIESENIECIVCHNDLKVENEIYAIPVWNQEKNNIDTKHGHVGALAICTQCGYSMTFILSRYLV